MSIKRVVYGFQKPAMNLKLLKATRNRFEWFFRGSSMKIMGYFEAPKTFVWFCPPRFKSQAPERKKFLQKTLDFSIWINLKSWLASINEFCLKCCPYSQFWHSRNPLNCLTLLFSPLVYPFKRNFDYKSSVSKEKSSN